MTIDRIIGICLSLLLWIQAAARFREYLQNIEDYP